MVWGGSAGSVRGPAHTTLWTRCTLCPPCHTMDTVHPMPPLPHAGVPAPHTARGCDEGFCSAGVIQPVGHGETPPHATRRISHMVVHGTAHAVMHHCAVHSTHHIHTTTHHIHTTSQHIHTTTQHIHTTTRAHAPRLHTTHRTHITHHAQVVMAGSSPSLFACVSHCVFACVCASVVIVSGWVGVPRCVHVCHCAQVGCDQRGVP